MGFFKSFAKWFKEGNERTREENRKRIQKMQDRKDQQIQKKETKLIEIEKDFVKEYSEALPIMQRKIVGVYCLKAQLYTAVEGLDYIGGSPHIEQIFAGRQVTVAVLNEHLLIKATGHVIKMSDITSIKLATEQEISKDVTLSRMLAFGVYSLALKKKKKTINSCLIINIRENGLDYSIAFGGDNKKVSKVYSDMFKKISLK